MAVKPQFFFMYGVFWQEVAGVDVGFLPIKGAAALVRKGVASFPFMGAIHRDHQGLSGTMLDQHGPSELRSIRLAEGSLHFSKRYEHHGFNPLFGVEYDLEQQSDGTWFGGYRTANGAWGPSRCFLQEADHALFLSDGEHFLKEWQRSPRK